MKVLVACECSGIVREAFKARGHDAWSCDLKPTEIPGQHIIGDVRDVIKEQWDLMIAHPPCTRLCRNSAKWIVKYQEITDACSLFNELKNANIERICIENPIPHESARRYIGDYSQIIQPWMFGHDYSKKTCLWLKNLPRLRPTNRVHVSHYFTPNGRKYTKGWYFTPRESTERSRTFPGIAAAMAEQWGFNQLKPALRQIVLSDVS